MKRLSKPLVGLLLTLLCVVALVTWLKVRHSTEAASIRERYHALKFALGKGDADTITSLTSPEVRGDSNLRFDWIRDHAGHLNENSDVSISGSKASVVPNRLYHFHLIPGGNSVGLVKVEGEWFFTGRISID